MIDKTAQATLTKLIRRHWFVTCLCLVFAITVIALGSTLYSYYIAPDTTSYFTIANMYAHFQFRHALNGYWGPLLSWLLVPAIWLHLNLVIAGGIISALSGVVIIGVSYGFLVVRGASRILAGIFSLVLALMLAGWIIGAPITPDLLLAMLTMLLVVALRRWIDHPGGRLAGIIGLIGAAMYFAKGFGLYLFLAMVGLLALWQWLFIDRRLVTTIRKFLPIAVVLVIFVLPFIALLSVKYHKLTINNAGSYDHRVFGPIMQGVQPMTVSGPIAPPNSWESSIWDDPSYMIHLMPTWSPLHSWHLTQYFLSSVLGRNLNADLSSILGFGPIVAFGLVAMAVGCLHKERLYRYDFWIMAIAAVLSPLGYALVFVQGRYLLATGILAVMAGFEWLIFLERSRMISRLQTIVGGVIIVGVMSLMLGQQAVASLAGDGANAGIEHLEAVKLGAVITPGSNIISDTFGSYYACYVANLHCFSVLSPPESKQWPGYYRQLIDMNVTYYIDFHTRDTDKNLSAFVHTYYHRVTSFSTQGEPVTVYRLR